jgi:hypothetical protein
MATSRRWLADLAVLLAGPLVWAAHFFSVYGADALICTGPGAASRGEEVLPVAAVLTVAAMVGLLGILGRQFAISRQARQTSKTLFWRDAPTALAALAGLAVLWAALPALLLPACSPSAA